MFGRFAIFLFLAAVMLVTACKNKAALKTREKVEADVVKPVSSLVFREYPSPNFNRRTKDVNTIVLHYTDGPTCEGALSHLANPKAAHPVSAHYVVDVDGTIYRMVPETNRAWHAGEGSWLGRTNLNDVSVGVEIVNVGHDRNGKRVPYPDEQIDAVIALCHDVKTRWKIDSVIGHSDLAVGRKQDPGEHFPWKRLHEAGLGIWTDDFATPEQPVHKMLAAIGYSTNNIPASVTAFQRHFHPEAISSGATNTIGRLAAVYRKVLSERLSDPPPNR